MTTEASALAGQRVLLIDLDNCPKEMDKLPRELPKFSRIIACYGAVEPRLTLTLVRALASAIHEGRLEFVGMQMKGKNAADFGLAFFAGRLMAEMPPETEFVILSGDRGLDHVVNLLRRENRVAKRVGTGTEVPATSAAEAVEEYYLERLRTQIHRPKRRKTLLSSIRSFFKGRQGVDGEGVLNGLIQRGLVVLDDQGLVTYPEIEQWNAEEAAAQTDECSLTNG
jgi:hypothetical protein